jgi:phosphatidate cytidylyltransferase
MNTVNGKFSSLPQRVAVAAVAIPIILWLAMNGGYYFFTFVLLIATVSLYEFYRLVELNGARPLKTVGLLAGALLVTGAISERVQIDLQPLLTAAGIRFAIIPQSQFIVAVFFKFVFITLLIELFRRKGSPTINVATTLAGVLLIPLFFSSLMMLRELFPYSVPIGKFFPLESGDEVPLHQIDRWGGYTVIALLASIWICDTAAYFGGLQFGKHRLMERASPKKSWEGFWFGFAAALLTMLAAQQLVLQYLSVRDAVVIGCFVGVFGQLGDLVQSRFKRDANVKDTSSLLPGHGGVYDRFDSLVFVSPIVYLYVQFVVLA